MDRRTAGRRTAGHPRQRQYPRPIKSEKKSFGFDSAHCFHSYHLHVFLQMAERVGEMFRACSKNTGTNNKTNQRKKYSTETVINILFICEVLPDTSLHMVQTHIRRGLSFEQIKPTSHPGSNASIGIDIFANIKKMNIQKYNVCRSIEC